MIRLTVVQPGRDNEPKVNSFLQLANQAHRPWQSPRSHPITSMHIYAFSNPAQLEISHLLDTLSPLHDHSVVPVGTASYPMGNFNFPNFTSQLTRFEAFDRDKSGAFGVRLSVRMVVMRRHLASTVASAIRREFRIINQRPALHWRGMQLIEEMLRGASQDEWVMIDYEDFLRRPLMYASLLARWFGCDNEDALRAGLETVKVRAADKDVLAESWQVLRDWDEQHASNNAETGFGMEAAVRDVMQKWQTDNDSVWNNECVVVSPDNASFAQQGSRCF